MKRKIFTALLVSSMLFVAACGSDKKNVELKNTTTFEQTGYTIDLPDTWTRTANSNTDLTFYYG